MGLSFGTKKKNVNESDFNGNYLRNFKSGETKVRFLEEPDEWLLYQEHYTRDRKSFPCTEDRNTCPGCTSEDDQVQRKSRKYGTTVLLVDPNQVLPFKLSISLVNRLTSRAERNGGTITNRDYIVLRSGEGLKTEYDVDQDEKYPLDTAELLRKFPNTIADILKEQFEAVWGDSDQYESKDEYKSGKPKDKPTESPFKDDDVPDSLKSKDELAKAEIKDEEVTEAQLKAMSRAQLVEVWEKAGWEGLDEDWGKQDLLQAILDRADA